MLRKRAHTSATGDLVGILEVDATGHRLHYVTHLLEAAGPDRCIVMTSEEAATSAEYRTHTPPLAASTVVLPGPGSRYAVLAAAVDRARAAGAGLLVVPEGDFYLLPLLRMLVRRPFRSPRVRLLLMRTATIGGPEPLRPATVVKPLLVRLLRLFPQVRVLFLTDALGVVTRRRGYGGVPAVRDPVRRVPEPVHERPSWFPPADPACLLVGAFGVISERKNLPLLVRALSRIPEGRLVVGGRLEPAVRRYVDTDEEVAALRADGRMVVADRLLDPDELAAGLATVDLVAVLHDNDSPSGILAEACIRRTPVLVPRGGWLAQVVDSTGIGVSAPLAPAAVAAGIRQAGQNHEAHVAAIRRHESRIATTDFTGRLLCD